ncbi:MAG: hypothetical protein NTW52_11295 [Planctomycetota bacterium]|nr:hypothetical protein [Planctomycetota bacterium]
MKIFLAVVFATVFVIVAIFAFFIYRLNRVVTSSKQTQYGPFTIRADASTGKTLNVNYGIVDQTTVRYSIWFNGKSIRFPDNLQTNTGLPFLWRVYALADASEPTLIAGSQSLYLISLKDGQPVLEPLVEKDSDFASLQFLDSDDGQPGEKIDVFMVGQTEGMENLQLLSGGSMLLVSGQLVFDIHTGKKHFFNQSKQLVDNYSISNSQGAIALSPDKKSIAYHGNFASWNSATEDLPDSDHAIVVYDFEADNGYAVKYDDTATRMTNTEEIDRAWLRTYFEWNKQPSGQEKLQLNAFDPSTDSPTPWLGKLDTQDGYYNLYPVAPSMQSIFLDFVLSQMGWTSANILSDETGEYTGRRILIGDATTKLDIVYRESDQRISFSKHLYLPYDPTNQFYPALIKRIADGFNAELTTGKHQEHFGKIINETKRIRSQ